MNQTNFLLTCKRDSRNLMELQNALQEYADFESVCYYTSSALYDRSMKYGFFADSLMVWAKMSTSPSTAKGSLLFRKTTVHLSIHCWRGTCKSPFLSWRSLLRHFLGYKETFLSLIAKPALLLSCHVVVGGWMFVKSRITSSVQNRCSKPLVCVQKFLFTLCGGLEGRDWSFLCICQWSKIGHGKVSSAF